MVRLTQVLIDSLFDEGHNAINMHALSATKANYRVKKNGRENVKRNQAFCSYSEN